LSGTFSSRTYNFTTLLGRSSFPDYTTRNVVIPKFQRGYSWEKSHVATFWEDLWDFHENAGAEDTYFLGPVVILPEIGQITILDGQQRLATATILFSVIRDIARQKGGQKGADFARDIQRDLIQIDADEEGIYAFTPSELDKAYFQNRIQNDPPNDSEKSAIRSHRLILQARNFIHAEVEGKITGKTATEIVGILKNLKASVAEKIKLVIIDVSSEEEAYQIFETLNDRGLRLSVPDLLLNHLMKSADNGPQRDQIRKYWDSVVEVTSTRKVSTFLRHMWVSLYGDVKSQGLFREIRQKLKQDGTKSISFAKQAADECSYYELIISCNAAALKKSEPHVQALVKSLREDKALPALLSGIQCLTANDYEKLSKCIVALVVRYSVICNLNPSALEDTLYKIARQIRQGKDKGNASSTILNNAKKELKKINPDDSSLSKGLEELYLNKAKAKYLLTEIANKMQSPAKVVKMDKTSIEHIYPENAELKEWPDKNILDPYIWHIGNLTMLEPKINKTIGNKAFSDKTPEFLKSEIDMANNIPGSYGKWNEANIVARAKTLAKVVKQIWRVV
jgi:hypothetical protein